ncbi:MAG: hypothetical protein AAF433_18130 [Bacteroidota bacterium]
MKNHLAWLNGLRLVLLLVFFSNNYVHLSAQSEEVANGWAAFAQVEFKRTLMDDGIYYMLVPQFDERIKELEGQAVQLRGYVMPFDYGDEPFFILSKFPYSSCFFCGGAGPESVAEIHLSTKPAALSMDQQIVVTGYLRLNDDDINQMNFILEESRIERTP